MNRYILTLIFALFALGINAQRHEIYASYSLGKAPVDALSHPFPINAHQVSGFESQYFSNKNATGILNIGYMFRISEKFRIGASWAHYWFKEAEHHIIKRGNDVLWGTQKLNAHSIFVNAKYDWFNYKKLYLYSKVGIGIGFYSADYKTVHSPSVAESSVYILAEEGVQKYFAWQTSPIGVELRPIQNLGVFVECGIGQQGMLNAGIKALF